MASVCFQRIADLVRVALGLQRQHLRFGLPADAALGRAGNESYQLQAFFSGLFP